MDKALKTMIDNIPEKTGRSLADWKILLSKQSFSKHMQAVNYLKTEFGVTHGFANTIVTLSKEDSSSDQDLVDSQYQGKEALLPIYEKLLEVVNSIGNDVTITAKKTSVSIIRGRQFALIKPATKKRIDLGLKLPGVEPDGRLESSGPFGTMCTHRVRLESIGQVDQELKNWLSDAYASAG
jgi:hypothetical protein